MPTTSPTNSADALKQLYAPVADSLAQVENILQSNLRSDTPWVDELLEHSWLLSGKRMRPVLLLLSGLAVAQRNDSDLTEDRLTPTLQPMAAAIEMIHTATLVHDDVIDDADMRRHEPTANSKWDNRISVLLGDYLFTHAFHVGSQSDSVKALAMLASASSKVCAGEMKQNFYAGRYDISTDVYFEIISEKTAELCAVSCAAGALLAGADKSVVDQFQRYGVPNY
jgi:octaprenyl-diphosphate synthase